MTDIILHHYPPSPVAEKIRTAMGIKQLAWKSVEENRLPDRPELLAMTGGYRRIPVMQIGADLYCDTQCILRELDRRIPEPTLFPNSGAGLPFALSRWTDVALFDLTVRSALVSATTTQSMPPQVVADRARLYFGPDADLDQAAADMPHTLAQLRAQLGWVDDRLVTGRAFILGDRPGMPDLLVWYIVWFFRARYPGADEFLSEFTSLRDWAERMVAIGHGTPTPMMPAEALAVARDCEPAAERRADPRDPQGLTPGDAVEISVLGDSGETPIAGTILAVSRDTVTLGREHPDCGRVAVHFPRVGYRVTARRQKGAGNP